MAIILFTDWLIVLLVACLFLINLIRSNVCYFLQSSAASAFFYCSLFPLLAIHRDSSSFDLHYFYCSPFPFLAFPTTDRFLSSPFQPLTTPFSSQLSTIWPTDKQVLLSSYQTLVIPSPSLFSKLHLFSGLNPVSRTYSACIAITINAANTAASVCYEHLNSH